jgi:FlaA1/EpsC-like NDP-sugar epimerase
MIRLSGKEPGRDIEVRFTGLRPGEKLYEELLASQEDTQPTHHPRILIGRVRPLPEAASGTLNGLMAAAQAADDARCVRLLKALIPEYRSQNSVYATFDAPAPTATTGADAERDRPTPSAG